MDRARRIMQKLFSKPFTTGWLGVAIVSCGLALGSVAIPASAVGADRTAAGSLEAPDVRLFFQATAPDPLQAQRALETIAASWRDGYAALFVDLASLMRKSGYGSDTDSAEARAEQHPSARVRRRLIRYLEARTGNRFGDDLERWRDWIWDLPYEPHPQYARFKGILYEAIDPRMRSFFPPDVPSTIRLDEVVWGGVKVDGIPPLDGPATLPAERADYLDDGDLVFGLVVGGDARAYPRRILGWHELARDRLGGVPITLVYCTLCGTAIPYDSRVGGTVRTLGTSGLLYRSNKLMYDSATYSLWSTIAGEPVVGSLVGSDLKLRALPVVTTTWGEWRDRHPETTVLSLETGHERDYSEGAAYREYFATDELMFGVPETDARLANKAEVLALTVEPAGRSPAEDDRVIEPSRPNATPRGGSRPLAIGADFLRDHPLYTLEFAGRRLVVVTSSEGANRVYDAGDVEFLRLLDPDRVVDAEGRIWRVREDALVPEAGQAESGKRREDRAEGGPNLGLRPRLPAHRAFWFGWHAQHPDTELIR